MRYSAAVSHSRVLAPSALSALLLLLANPASADAPAGPSDMEQAMSAFAEAEKALAASPPCETMCKALHSMARAAEHICELARDGTALDQKRCVDARAKVEEATARVRAACPDCVTSKPDAPVTAAETKSAPVPPAKAGTGAAAGADQPGKEQQLSGTASVSDSAESAGVGLRSSVLLDVLPLFTPPGLVSGRFVRRVGPRASVAIGFGLGSLPTNDGRSTGRTLAVAAGGELRILLAGRFDGFSTFVGASFAYREANALAGRVTARSFTPGTAIGPELGTRLVLSSGLTIEARAGFEYLVQDRRGLGAPTDRVLPLGAISVGWTF